MPDGFWSTARSVTGYSPEPTLQVQPSRLGKINNWPTSASGIASKASKTPLKNTKGRCLKRRKTTEPGVRPYISQGLETAMSVVRP